MQLTEIKNEILNKLCAVSKLISAKREDYNVYLQRLIDDIENNNPNLDKRNEPLSLKAGKQLLCCIGIDLRKNIVPIEHYVKIFELIDINNYIKEARMLFDDPKNENNLHYTGTCVKTTNTYTISICALRDWEYYIDKDLVGVASKDEESYTYNLVRNYIEDSKLIRQDINELYKGNNKYFWLCTEEEYLEINNKSANPAVDLVDKLGLSHFDFNNDWQKRFFCINLSEIEVCTMSPNATLVDWSSPKVGFLSQLINESGRTYSIRGRNSYFKNEGVRERILHRHELSDNEKQKVKIQKINGVVDVPLPIASEELISEGLNRYEDLTGYENGLSI